MTLRSLRHGKMTRKNSDNNPTELLLALLVKNCDESVSEKPDWLKCENFDAYMKNLLKYDRSKLKKFKDNFNTQKKESWSSCVEVCVPGKKKFDHPLLKDIDRKTAKADVYLKFPDSTVIGLSVKQAHNATKTNYSVEKMLGKEHGQKCSKIRKQYLLESGFPKHNKENREKVNSLFRDRNNVYWNAVRSSISIQNELIRNDLVKYLYSTNNPFEIWEFDGQLLKLLGIKNTAVIKFEEYHLFYSTVSGNTRNAAKLFYKLDVIDGDMNQSYRVEIRWKGNIHSASPQFQTHVL